MAYLPCQGRRQAWQASGRVGRSATGTAEGGIRGVRKTSHLQPAAQLAESRRRSGQTSGKPVASGGSRALMRQHDHLCGPGKSDGKAWKQRTAFIAFGDSWREGARHQPCFALRDQERPLRDLCGGLRDLDKRDGPDTERLTLSATRPSDGGTRARGGYEVRTLSRRELFHKSQFFSQSTWVNTRPERRVYTSPLTHTCTTHAPPESRASAE